MSEISRARYAKPPTSSASLPIRYLFCDEVDKLPLSAAAEGDPIALALGRTTNYWNRKSNGGRTRESVDIPYKIPE